MLCALSARCNVCCWFTGNHQIESRSEDLKKVILSKCFEASKRKKLLFSSDKSLFYRIGRKILLGYPSSD